MAQSPLTMARRHILGDLYGKCEPVVDVPVYLNDSSGEPLGHVDESLGKYADAFTFHVADDICKKLASGQFTFSFEYEHAKGKVAGSPRRIRLRSIVLIARKGYDKPVSKAAIAAKADAAEEL
jgi:hypothetical protein